MSTTGPTKNPVDVTDHHHNQNLNNDSYAVISTTSEIVEMKNNLPMRIDNNSVTTTTTTIPMTVSVEGAVLNNDINQNQKTNWVQFDDDDNSNNNNTMTNQQQNNVNKTAVVVGAAAVGTAINSNNNNKLTTSAPPTIATVDVTTNNSTTIKKGIPVLAGPPVVQANSRLSQKSIQEITPAPAVLSHVNLNIITTSPQSSTTAVSSVSKNVAVTSTSANNSGGGGGGAAQMRTIELSTGRIREGFANGDIIVTLLPTNSRWPWVTPAVFRPELVPEELMAQGLTLTVEEYVNAMETLVNDYRFTVYNVCYKRVLVCWIVFAFCVLLTLLFSGLKGIALFSLGVGWLFLNAAAIFFCMWVKLRLSRGLEKCLARVNKLLIRHKIILVLDDRGRISCHKVNLCFLYFDPSQCIAYLNDYIERSEQNGANIQAGWEERLDVDVNDIVIQGNNPVRLSRKQERGLLLYLRYGSRWGNEVIRGLGDISVIEPARHCANFICPCQYIERHLACKPRGKLKFLNIIYWVLASERYEN